MGRTSSRASGWIYMALLNFTVAALAGATLRYKVTFPFPLVEFKNLLHAHSHFAFAGWVTTGLFALLIGLFLTPEQQEKKSFRTLFLLSQLTAYGMLFSFLWQEYGPVSIAFSTAYIFVTYAFAFQLWKETRPQKNTLSAKSLRASLIFLAVSSLGPYGLAYIKAAAVLNGELYHNAIYWYLHFQYNGWFSFALFALFLRRRENQGKEVKAFRLPYLLMLCACVPTYLLSILWIMPPLWVFIVAGLAGTIQMVALLLIIGALRREKRTATRRDPVRLLLLFSFIAFSIKLVLQFLSVFPTLNQFVFGHRPVIIGYLHLVMLGFVSFYIFGVSIAEGYFRMSQRGARVGLWTFIIGVLLNEVGLMIQGFSGILFITAKWTPEVLFLAAVLMWTGLAVFTFQQRRRLQAEEAASGSLAAAHSPGIPEQ